MDRKLIEGSFHDISETEAESLSSFSEKNIRLGFIRKVYGILTVQLAVTLTLMSLIVFVDPVKLYCQQNVWVIVVAFSVTLTVIIALACCQGIRRSYPSNVIFLAIFTICEGFLLGITASYFEKQEVFLAVGVTSLVVFALTMFAFQTKIDFTILNGLLFVLIIILIILGLLCLIFRSNYLSLLYSCLGALIFSLYIIVDTQMIVGGKARYSISPEEYVFAALNIYLDVINLFLMILDITGRSK